MTPRRRPTAKQRREIHARQSGLCACGCGRPLGSRWDVDHAHALGLGGGNESDNLVGLSVACHKSKTARDKAGMAKADRLAGRTGSQYHGTNAHRGRLGIPGWRKKMSGEVVRDE